MHFGKYFNDSYLVKTYGQTREEFGDKSFGYDCFCLMTWARFLGLQQVKRKNSVSHRKRAILDLIEKEK